MKVPKILACVCALLLSTTYVKASTYLDVGEDVYNTLQGLEAEGVITSGFLTTKPLSRKEVIRLILEAEKNSEGRSPFIRNQIALLKEKFKDEINETRYIKPLEKVNATYIHADEKPSELSYNNDGDDYEDGSNLRFGAASRAEFGWASIYFNPEIRYSDDDTELEIKKAYGVLDLWGAELEIGKDSQWWGPGYHGALLLSNNPEPLTMLKLTNSAPILLPWVFRHLGLFKFTGFVTELEEDRVVPEPYLWGMRISLKPIPYLELGLHRTALFGGEGRSSDLSAWWKSFTGEGENEEDEDSGDQRAGYDIKLTMPFDLQPFQLYLEADGEDEAGGLPSNYAFLYGIFFPRLLDIDEVGLRAEYADNHISGKPNVWYNHSIYQSGYTYKDRIIGHHMGTDSKDMFIEASYFITRLNGKIALAYDRKEHNLSDDIREKKQEIYMTADMDVTEFLGIMAAYGYGKIDNPDQIPGTEENINTVIIQLTYDF